MDELRQIFDKGNIYSFNRLKKELNIDKRTLKDLLDELLNEQYIEIYDGKYKLIKRENIDLIENLDNRNEIYLENYLQLEDEDKNKYDTVLAICKYIGGNLFLNNYDGIYLLKCVDNKLDKLVDGDMIIVKVKKENLKLCNYIERIGHVDDVDIDLKVIAISNSFKIEFSKSSLKQADAINNHVLDSEMVNRLDLRDKCIYTIDSKDTKDMDDAISVEKLPNGNYELGVHIADVAHYVEINTPLFNEALNRGTSVYLIDRVVPMLPHKLSNGICSLNPNVDRLTLSCIMEIDQNGNVVNHKICESVIRSRKKMTYEDVDRILNYDEIVEGYEDYIDNLKLCNELSFILQKKFNENNFLHFKSYELKVKVDKEGKPLEFDRIVNLAGRKIIENFMLIANKTFAESYEYMPFVFRVHETPDYDKLNEVLDNFRAAGYNLNITDLENPAKLTNIFKELYESGNYSITSSLLLRAMSKARYSENNVGHFGSGFNCYAHTTSPIRRFSDLMVQTLYKMYNNCKSDDELRKIETELPKICEHISNTEINADKAEEEAVMFEMIKYMQNYIGEYFNGKVVNLGRKHIEVRLVNNIIGNVDLDQIKGDLYHYDGDNYRIVGINTGTELKIGDYVRVKVISVSKFDKEINFKLVEKLEKRHEIEKVLIKEMQS